MNAGRRLARQVEQVDEVLESRVRIWERYFEALRPLEEDGHLVLRIPLAGS